MISTADMKALEDKAKANGLSTLTLMENAGKGIADTLEQKTELKDKRLLVICYHGNNGGDGFVAARLLSEKAEVDVLFIGDETKFKPEAKENYKKIEETPLIQFITLDYIDFNDYDIIIDAILGTGIEGELKYPLGTVIDFVNDTKAFKLSVDVPTGLDPDTGKTNDKVINPDIIVTFHELKKGLKKLKEKTVIIDIGL